MMNLKNHPFDVKAFFERSLVLTYAVPKEEIQDLIPSRLTLDTYDDKWAFIAAAMVQTKHLRPAGFPSFMGRNFFLIGFRIFVRYQSKSNKNLRGLYILRSETDKKSMEFLGNVFTRYKYHTTDIQQFHENNILAFHSKHSGIDVQVDLSINNAPLPVHSPFTEWKVARRFAGPLPHTFTYLEKENSVIIVQGLRQHWKPEPVHIVKHNFSFIDSLQLDGVVLANAFQVTNIPYEWKKGRIERWG